MDPKWTQVGGRAYHWTASKEGNLRTTQRADDEYNPQAIEPQWRARWAATAIYRAPTPQLTSHLHRTIQRVTADIETFKFNTAIAALMECLNELSAHYRAHGVTAELAKATHTFALLLAPFAPYVAEELWARLGGPYSVHQQAWPAWDETLAAKQAVTLVVQVDGRVRDRLTVPADISEAEARERALDCAGVRRHLDGRRVFRVVYVPVMLHLTPSPR